MIIGKHNIHFHKWEKEYEVIRTEPHYPVNEYDVGYSGRTIGCIQYRVCKKCNKKIREVQDSYLGKCGIRTTTGRDGEET